MATSRRIGTRSKAELATAYHEAVHALLAVLEGIRIHQVNVIGGKGYDERVLHDPVVKRSNKQRLETGDISPTLRMQIEAHARVALAGTIAQKKFDPGSLRSYHSTTDNKNAVDLINCLTASVRETEARLNLLSVQAEQRLKIHWPAVRRFVPILLEKRRISGTETKTLLTSLL